MVLITDALILDEKFSLHKFNYLVLNGRPLSPPENGIMS